MTFWDPGMGSEYSSRRFQRFFRRWGALSNLRSVLNYVQPVTLVDRFRDDDEGSLFAVYFETGSAVNEHPAILFGSNVETVDLEIVGLQAWYSWQAPPLGVFVWNMLCHVFTPLAPYNPVANVNPVGVGVPGLMTNERFTRGNSYAIGGHNPALPAYPGWTGWVCARGARQTNIGDAGLWFAVGVDGIANILPNERPLRLYGTDGVSIQLVNPGGGLPLALAVTILYRERAIL